MGADFNYPYLISQDTPAVAIEVQGNFDGLLAWIKTNYRQVDDTPNMTVRMVVPSDGGATNPQHVVTKSEVDAVLPTGMITQFGGNTAPTGWAMCNGGVRPDSDALFAVIGHQYGNPGGGNYNLPNMQGKFPRGGTNPDTDRGAEGGSDDAVVVAHSHTASFSGSALGNHKHTMPTHSHSMNHTHPDSEVDVGGLHASTGLAAQGTSTLPDQISDKSWSVFNTQGVNSGFLGNGDRIGTADIAQHTGSTGSKDPGDTNNASAGTPAGSVSVSSNGVSGTDANLPEYVTVNYIIKL